MDPSEFAAPIRRPRLAIIAVAFVALAVLAGCGLAPQRERAPMPPPVPTTTPVATTRVEPAPTALTPTLVSGRRAPSINDMTLPVDLNIIPANRMGRMDVAGGDMPQGHYLIVLEFDVGSPDERRVRANFEISGNQIRCVNSSDREFIGLTGNLQPDAGGRIVVPMRNEYGIKTQFWERAGEGRWRVLESPDRGEKQVAIPVDDRRIE